MTIKIPCVPFTLHIGQAGENGFRPIDIDWSAWQTEYPNGTLSIIIARPDGETYPSVVGITESPYTYIPTGLDTEVAGNGSMEFVLSDGDTIGKTLTFPIVINESLTAGEVPTPVPTWMQDVFDASDKAVEAVSHYPYIGANGNWFVWDADTEQFVDTGDTSRGEQGETGNGIASIAKTSTSGNVDTYTITMTDGSTATFTVTNAIEPLDESAKVTSALTFSAKKVYSVGGKIISFTIRATNSTGATIQAGSDVLNLTASIRPVVNIRLPLYIGNNLSSLVVRSSTGVCVAADDIPNGAEIFFTGTYALA